MAAVATAYPMEQQQKERRFEEIIGDSPALEQVLEQVELVAPTDASVLILGETGTGKELIARAIHSASAETNSVRAPDISNRPKASTSVQISIARKTFYLEAPARTQDLFAAQRALRSAGCAIGSTWHDRLPGPEEPGSDWIRERLEELKKCDALIVLCGEKQKAPLQLPLLAGYAIARGMRVIWIGTSVQITCRDRNVSQFDTIEEFCGSPAVRLAA